MTSQQTPSAQWDALTDEQKTDWLKKYMGYEKYFCMGHLHANGQDYTVEPNHEYLWMRGDRKHIEKYDCPYHVPFKNADGRTVAVSLDPSWNPLTDWNHWRQVEERVMEDNKLWWGYLGTLWQVCTPEAERMTKDPTEVFSISMKSDLPTHCKALYLAWHSIHSK